MTAAAPLFDRLIYVQRLRNAGVDEQQAIAQADALDGAFRESVATKADLAHETAALKLDIAELKTEIQQIDGRIDVLEANIKAEFAVVRGGISAVRTDLAGAIERQTVWLGGTMIALLAIGVTLAKTL